MQFIVKLKFISPLHIGKGKPDYYAESETVLHSDTIKSALFSTAKLLDNSTNIDFWNSFVVSSSMPYYEKNLFFPKPNLNKIDFSIHDNDNDEILQSDNLKLIKKIKKVKFIQKSVFEEFNQKKKIKLEDYQFVGNAIWDKDTIIDFVKANFLKNKEDNSKLLTEFEKFDNKYKAQILKEYSQKISLIKKGIQERVKINTLPEDDDDGKPIFSRPYNIERLYFNENSGLYFIVDDKNNINIKSQIENILKTLGDIGFGTDKSVGNGQFVFEIEENFETTQLEKADFKMNLSLYLPDDLENCKQNIYRYNLIERGGYIANYVDLKYQGVLRNTISMFDEGSVFKYTLKDTGKFVDLKPDNFILPDTQNDLDHPVWRDGRSLFVPINFKLKEN